MFGFFGGLGGAKEKVLEVLIGEIERRLGEIVEDIASSVLFI